MDQAPLAIPLDAVEITIPNNCPELITAIQPKDGTLQLQTKIDVDGSALFVILRDLLLPFCFGVTCLPAVPQRLAMKSIETSEETDEHHGSSQLANIDIRVTRTKKPETGMERETGGGCTGATLQADIEFEKEHRIAAIRRDGANLEGNNDVVPASDLPALKPIWVDIFKGLYEHLPEREKRTGKEQMEDTANPSGWLSNPNSNPGIKSLHVLISWCVHPDQTAQFKFEVVPNNGPAHIVNEANVISLLISQWRSMRGRHLMTGPLFLTQLDPSTPDNSKLLLFSIAQALNERISFEYETKTITLRCFYYLMLYLISPKERDYKVWLRGFLGQAISIFMAHKGNMPRRTRLVGLLNDYFTGKSESCLQNDEITVSLQERKNRTERKLLHYSPKPEESTWGGYRFGIPSGFVEGVKNATSATVSGVRSRLLAAHEAATRHFRGMPYAGLR